MSKLTKKNLILTQFLRSKKPFLKFARYARNTNIPFDKNASKLTTKQREYLSRHVLNVSCVARIGLSGVKFILGTFKKYLGAVPSTIRGGGIVWIFFWNCVEFMELLGIV